VRPVLPALAGAIMFLIAIGLGVLILELGTHVDHYGPGRVALECVACHGGVRS
jgi:hypothetical protein